MTRGASNHRRPTPDRGSSTSRCSRIRRWACDVTAAIGKRDDYARQLRDVRGSIWVDNLSPSDPTDHAPRLCAVLARAHARSGAPVAIAAHLGRGDAFERAISRCDRVRRPGRER
jgi:Uncharacterized protein conserved in bacteria (DUF2252)